LIHPGGRLELFRKFFLSKANVSASAGRATADSFLRPNPAYSVKMRATRIAIWWCAPRPIYRMPSCESMPGGLRRSFRGVVHNVGPRFEEDEVAFVSRFWSFKSPITEEPNVTFSCATCPFRVCLHPELILQPAAGEQRLMFPERPRATSLHQTTWLPCFRKKRQQRARSASTISIVILQRMDLVEGCEKTITFRLSHHRT